MLVSATPPAARKRVAAPNPTTVPWLWIERATNGYLVRDAAVNETWLIADDDWLEAAADLLAEINDRLGSRGEVYDARRVVVSVEPGEHWLQANPAECLHRRVRNTSPGASGLWECVCGVEFTPVADGVNVEVAS